MKKTTLFSLIFILSAGTALALTRSEVEKNLICYACPGEALNIDRCSGGDQMRSEIDRRLDLGQGKEEILNYFVDQFGEDILTAPPKKGFNLVAYTAPFIGLLIGLIVAGIFAWKWAVTNRKAPEDQEYDAESQALLQDMEGKITDELKKLEED